MNMTKSKEREKGAELRQLSLTFIQTFMRRKSLLLCYFIFLCPLTSPPSRTSWSSVTIRTMLLAFALVSSHLPRQVSSADSSTVTAAEAPLRRLVDAPVLILWTAIGSPRHKHTHARTELFD